MNQLLAFAWGNERGMWGFSCGIVGFVARKQVGPLGMKRAAYHALLVPWRHLFLAAGQYKDM